MYLVLLGRFFISAVLGQRWFPAIESKNKKDGRRDAADKALRILMAEGQYHIAPDAIPVSCVLNSSDPCAVEFTYSFALAKKKKKKKDEYGSAMPIPCSRMMSQINCGDVTMLSQN